MITEVSDLNPLGFNGGREVSFLWENEYGPLNFQTAFSYIVYFRIVVMMNAIGVFYVVIDIK